MAFRTQWRPSDQFLMRHMDTALMIVEKKAGLLTHSAAGSHGAALHDLLREFCARRRPRAVLPIHRLDRVVSGLLVYARSGDAQEKLAEQFKEHTVERRYVAAVSGTIEQDEGTFESFLNTEDPSLRVYAVPKLRKGVKRAITHWKVVERIKASRTTLVQVRLETGVRNQIRVHFADAGFHLLGERKYADQSRLQGTHRIFLHAEMLGFIHPYTNKPVRWEAQLPPDLLEWKKRMEHGHKSAPRRKRARRRRR